MGLSFFIRALAARAAVAGIGPRFQLPALALALALAGAGPVSAAPEGSRFDADYFTNLPVVTHEGKEVPFYDGLIKGKMVVVNFVYLNCNDICPLTTSRVAQIKQRLGDAVGRDVFIYSITMDPGRDTPELLKEYADAFGAGNGWYFVTGKPEHINQIRWKIGERSRSLSEHRNDMMLGNDATGEWSRYSVYADLDLAVATIRDLDPAVRATRRALSTRHAAAEIDAYRLDKHPGQALYIKACSTCHSIGGGDFIGPDLAHIGHRRERGWLTRFLMSPEKMRAEKDPLTVEISQKYKGVMMPNLGLKENDVADVLLYIEARSHQGEAAGSGATAPGPKPPGG
ncbi:MULTISPECIES: SCO family protein [Rhodomicrobium]|uniref:SCO family protein n=1 Tax=Rhodomicrobium TaxID=1068 RepID=UPI000B4B0F6C|nr:MULTISPECIES: SCO family protein [Rhodomicrobium]